MDQNEIKELAVRLGCNPRWSNGMLGWAWHCTCSGLDHACDSQCSTITEGSIKYAEQRIVNFDWDNFKWADLEGNNEVS